MKLECAAVQPSSSSVSPRLFVTTRNDNLRFLIDTGSDVSALPSKFANVATAPTNYRLFAVNGSSIPTYGTIDLVLDVGLPKTYKWTFIVADVSQPIIGADLLTHHNLLPNLKQKKLIDGTTLCSTQCDMKCTDQSSISSIHSKVYSSNSKIREILSLFPNITKPPQYHCTVNHDVICYIETTGSPTYDKPRRLRPDIEQKVRLEYKQQVEIGLASVSRSQWASGLIVKQEKKKFRLIGDYRRVNAQTVPDRYPIPIISDARGFLRGKKVYSKVDLVRAFHNIPVHKPHICKTAVISPVGLYEYNRMPFGLRNAPSTFQRFMNSVVADLPFCTVYIDDILIYSDSPDEHYNHLKLLFQQLDKFGLTINLDKCSFCVTELDFLGYRITNNGITPTEQRVEFFKKMQHPRTIAALRSILGVLNFYRQFTRKAATVLAPLQELLKGHPKKNDKSLIPWTEELKKNFDEAKTAFINYTLLHYQQHDAPLTLTCDASRVAIGAVLEQVNSKGEKEPLGYFSRKLEERETRWPVYDLELLAIYEATVHFELMVIGRRLTIRTDHRPLTYLYTTKKPCRIERRSRHAEYIAQFSTDIQHVAGDNNIIADALSRPEEPEVSQINAKVTVHEIARQQANDAEIRFWKINGYRDQRFKTVNVEGSQILCSTYKGKNRPLVPANLRLQIFKQVHDIAHNGLKATLKLIRDRYYWPKMTEEIRKWHRTCLSCQKVKTQRHTKPPLGTFPQSERFEHVHMDLVGPLKPSQGYTYLCTFVDRATRWIEAIPLRTVTAEKVAEAFYNQWIARYGTPLRVTTDRGPQFRSDLFLELTKLLGAEHIKTTSYHPQSNGAVERVHRRLKELLICHAENWYKYLPSILLGLRAAPRDDSGTACSEMVFGQAIRLPGEMYSQTGEIRESSTFVRDLRNVIRKLKPAPYTVRRKDSIFVHKDLHTCKKVFVRVDKVKTSLEAPYQGPYTVLKRHKHCFVLDIEGKEDTVSIHRLKPAYELDEEPEATVQEPKVPKPILKVKGNDPHLVNVGHTSDNTKANSRIVYVKDAQSPLFPTPSTNTVTIQTPPSASRIPIATSQQRRRSLSLGGNREHCVQNQSRHSTRNRRPPTKYRDFTK